MPPQPPIDLRREALDAAQLLSADRWRLERRRWTQSDWDRELAAARVRAEAFRAVRPRLQYPESLPVSTRRVEIIEAIRAHPVVILCGDTGSGKTTQLPKMMLEAGAGEGGRIGVTQPRRLAAMEMARRVAEECGTPLGEAVGVQIRFEKRGGENSRIQFMTEGVLLARLHRDPDWREYTGLIIDEAHERGLNLDFMLGHLRMLLPRRPDLRVVISSATLDAARFSDFFGRAPVLQVEGRLHEIQDEYLPSDPAADVELPDRIVEAIRHLDRKHGPLDTLVFLPGEREIHETAQRLEGQGFRNTEILPLYSRLGQAAQQQVFQTGLRRRVILATNVAETSLTLPGIRAVVDSGLARIHRFHPQSGIQRLHTEQISQASARQRRGRCGRTGPGICLRLYTEEDLLRAREQTDPEILRSSLAEVILRMAALGLPDLRRFPLLDAPKGSRISEGYRALFEIGAMTDTRRLTRRGRRLATFPLDPRLARMLEAGEEERCLPELVVCAAFLSLQDPRERPPDRAARADGAREAWRDPNSDFLGILQMWNDLAAASGSRSRRHRYCREKFLHPRRVDDWFQLVRELGAVCRRQGWTVSELPAPLPLTDPDGIHRAILAGIPRRVGQREEGGEYRSPGGRNFHLFPGSGPARKPPEWVFAFSLIETSRLYARECARLRPEWVERVAPHLCKWHYERPCWNRERGFVEAEESVRLGPLTLRSGKQVHYGRVEPVEARRIFIADALSGGNLDAPEMDCAGYFRMLRTLERWERKLRRPGFFTGSGQWEAYLERALPAEMHSTREFVRWCRESRWTPRVGELLGNHDLREEDYPDQLTVGEVTLEVDYVHSPAAAARDGVHLVVREDDLGRLPEEVLEWTIPAWLLEKIERLIKTLDKRLRQRCHPLPQTAREALAWMEANGFVYTHSLSRALAAFLAVRLDCILAAPDFDPEKLPPHLRPVLRVMDDRGRVLHEGKSFPGGGASPVRASAREPAALTGFEGRFRDWPEADFPREISTPGGPRWTALCPEGNGVRLRLLSDPAYAAEMHRAGLVWLFRQQQSDVLRYLQKRLPFPASLQLALLNMPAAGADILEDVVDGILAEAMGLYPDPPRDAADFRKACDQARASLFEVAEKRGAQLRELLAQRDEVREALDGVTPCHLQADLALQESMLWSPGWVRDPVCLNRYPKYLRGMLLRISRCLRDPQKDEFKQRGLDEVLESLAEHSGRLNPRGLREAFLKVEELRLTVFAPELRPHEKAGAARVIRWLEERV